MEQQTKHIYISGAITGLDPEAVAAKFAAKQNQLQAEGHNVFNPVQFINELVEECKAEGVPYPEKWEDFMKICIGVLVTAQEVHLLPGWQNSKGATMERDVARRLGIHIVYPHLGVING